MEAECNDSSLVATLNPQYYEDSFDETILRLHKNKYIYIYSKSGQEILTTYPILSNHNDTDSLIKDTSVKIE